MKKEYQKKLVTDEIIALIHKNKLPIGGRIPSERQLTEQLNVSRNTVREAIRELEARGRVKAKSGSGCFITSHDDCADWVSLRGLTTPEVLRDHMEALSVLIPLITSQAVERATRDDIKALQQIVVGLSNAILTRDFPRIADALLDFNRELARIHGNRFYILMIQEMNLEKHILLSILSQCTTETIQAMFKAKVELMTCFRNKEAGKAADIARTSIRERHALYVQITHGLKGRSRVF